MSRFLAHSSVMRASEDGFQMVRRIPIALLDEVAEYFRKDLSLEAVVQIWYDEKFYIVYPEWEEATKTDIAYRFAWNNSGEYVCNIHSHNTMSAFWSTIDDEDELSLPGLYGVFGNLDREDYSSRFRYCPGHFCKAIPLHKWDIACN